MYVTDAIHFLDEKGAIGPKSGPGLKLSNFFGRVIVLATSHSESAINGYVKCIKCESEQITALINSKNEVAWKCNGCGETGVITNWQGTLWDWTEKKTTSN